MIDAADPHDPMTAYAIRSAVRQAASDGQAMATRRALCRVLVGAFESAGQTLRLGGHIIGDGRADGTSPLGNGDDGTVALGYISCTCASLISGATDLLERGNCYAASALNRQLVELEYLSWAFAEDHDEAANWLRSDRAERMKRWQPRHMRERSNGLFRGSDYGNHCEIGGHPTPSGVRALNTDHMDRTMELMYSETATHGLSAWEYLRVAVRGWRYTPDDGDWATTTALVETIEHAAKAWRTHDHLAATWQALAPSTDQAGS
jgi:hypothetical protein